jgi:hypothetical protein
MVLTVARASGALLFAAASIGVALMAAEPKRLDPVDEGRGRPDFQQFRSGLQAAVAARDVEALLRAVSPDIKNTFGDDNGIEAFTRRWRLDRRDSPLWKELGTVLSLGGSFEGPDSFVAPYVFSRWPGDYDSFEHVAVVGSNVRVRSGPAAGAGIIDTVSYAVLELGRGRGDRQQSWTPVILADGRAGFVAAHLVRSPIDYRADFTRAAGRWLMTVFVAGD